MELGHERVVAKRLDAPYLPGQRIQKLAEAQVPRLEAGPRPAPPASGAGLGESEEGVASHAWASSRGPQRGTKMAHALVMHVNLSAHDPETADQNAQ